MTVFTLLWIIWIVMFIAIETVAIMNDKADDTLSEHLRQWFSTDTKKGRWIWIIISGIFFCWFGVHIAMEGSV
jgi:hypothetical protein